MKTSRFLTAAALIASVGLPVFAQTKTATKTAAPKPVTVDIDIPYQKFVLDNGLTVIVHEDHKAPIVAVNVWYHVGSKNEKPGKSGFAHLFEHLMFNGSENYNKDYFQVLERIGATDLNGTTNEDRTNYFQNVPKSALDLALWMESDRMGHLLGAIDQPKLDEQRGVVQNEKRQSDNEPYSMSEELVTKAVFPANHPYSWTVIGSMEDLNAAALDDVKQWFRDYYGAANAVVVVAGDVDAKTAKEKVEKYFGDIPSGPPVARHQQWIAKRTGTQRQVAQDRVPQARIYKVWNVPPRGTVEHAHMELLAGVLGSGKTSRLYKRLVYDDQSATQVQVFLDTREIGSLFYVMVTAKPGEDLVKVEKAIDEEMARLLADGPTATELERVRTQYLAGFTRGVERIGGFGGKSDILAQSQVYGGSPDFYKTVLGHVRNTTVADLHKSAKNWLGDGQYVLEIHPFPTYKVAEAGADRKSLPDAGEAPAPKFPTMEKAKLSNGMQLIVAERHSVPVVNFSLLVDAGYAADQFSAPGTAALAMNMLDEGTKSRNALQISEELALLGGTLGTGSALDSSFATMSALKPNLDASLAIFSDVLLNPSFPQEDFVRLQRQQIAAIQREKVQPIQMALRVFPRFLYGENHAYGNPLTGSGTEGSVAKMTREDLQKFHTTWFKPNNATLVVVGDTTLAEIQPKLEKILAGWKGGDVPVKNLGTVQHVAKPVVYLVDKPGAVQSVILAGHVAPPKSNPEEIAIETMNTVLGGAFISRMNMNLREDKHWSYGAGSFMPGARGQRPFIVYAPVQTDKTKESMTEVMNELRSIATDKPVNAEELAVAQSNMTLQLPGSWETNNDVVGSITEMVRFGLPEDYYDTYAGRVKALGLADTAKAGKTVVHPDNLVWVVVGDRAKIEAGIRELNLGEIRLIDADGNPVK